VTKEFHCLDSNTQGNKTSPNAGIGRTCYTFKVRKNMLKSRSADIKNLTDLM